MYVFLNSQYEFCDETLATAGLEGAGAAIWRDADAGRAAEETNALVLRFLLNKINDGIFE